MLISKSSDQALRVPLVDYFLAFELQYCRCHISVYVQCKNIYYNIFFQGLNYLYFVPKKMWQEIHIKAASLLNFYHTKILLLPSKLLQKVKKPKTIQHEIRGESTKLSAWITIIAFWTKRLKCQILWTLKLKDKKLRNS